MIVQSLVLSLCKITRSTPMRINMQRVASEVDEKVTLRISLLSVTANDNDT